MKEIKKSNISNNIIAFMILLVPFNYSIISSINGITYYLIHFLPFIALIYLGLKYIIDISKTKRISRIEALYFIFFVIMNMFILHNNGELISKNYYSFALFEGYLLLPLFMINNKNMIKAIFKVIPFFILEHVIGVLFELLFNELYIDFFINRFLGGSGYTRYYLLMSWIKQGYLAGFTTNYSSCAMSLGIGVIFYLIKLLKNRNWKNIIKLIIVLVCLLLTAKRAVLFFSLISFIIVYIISEKKINKKVKRIITITITFIIVLLLLGVFSTSIPELGNIFTRINAIFEDDTFGNRMRLYTAAVDYWKIHPLIGNGWKTFMLYYNQFLPSNAMYSYDVHNVYLQLLCENGIIGMLVILIPMLTLFIKNFKVIKNTKMSSMSYFSVIFQLYFFLYCITGNPLYDCQCYVPYLISIGVTFYMIKKGGDDFE